MKIVTIHAFCQSLLRRFPLEAGLAPHFQVMDDRDAGEMLIRGARRDPGRRPPDRGRALARALSVVAGAVHELAFPDLMAELAGERGRLRRLIDRHGGLGGRSRH